MEVTRIKLKVKDHGFNNTKRGNIEVSNEFIQFANASRDGIGPEVINEVERVIEWFNMNSNHKFEIEKDLVGGAAYDEHGQSISDEAMDLAHKSDAVIFGAVGGPKWDNVPFEVRPEAGLLRLRKELDLFANLRPAICYKALLGSIKPKKELVEGLDILILRELTGGVYFGEPKEITDLPDGQKRAVDTQVYTTSEIERIARVAFDLAKTRKGKVTSTEKRNVMISGVFWNNVVSEVHKNEYPEMELEHMLADACAMQLVRKPKQFDLIVADNLFGDILSDEAAMLTGSMGMLPSASLGAVNPNTDKRNAMYEPVHGSAPDISGQGIANPIAEIASFAMALRYSFNLTEEAKMIEDSISAALDQGIRTPDIMQDGMKKVGTKAITDAIIAEMNSRA